MITSGRSRVAGCYWYHVPPSTTCCMVGSEATKPVPPNFLVRKVGLKVGFKATYQGDASCTVDGHQRQWGKLGSIATLQRLMESFLDWCQQPGRWISWWNQWSRENDKGQRLWFNLERVGPRQVYVLKARCTWMNTSLASNSDMWREVVRCSATQQLYDEYTQ